MRLAVVMVHYHTPELALDSLQALRREVVSCGIATEWILVDNGSHRDGRELLRSLPVRLLEPGRNLGYAGAVNLGVESSSAERILFLNPDVVVLKGCIETLLKALDAGAAAVGPRFYWDREKRLLLPPAEARDRWSELSGRLAQRGQRWARTARRRWRRHAWRHWQSDHGDAGCKSFSLSGALLATDRRVWHAVGPLDTAYKLYFEETDWLLRLKARGLVARFVPRAEALHLYAQSSIQEPRAQGWFADSARRFQRRHYGRRFASLLAALERGAEKASAGPERRPTLPPGRPALAPADLRGQGSHPLWVEVSPNPAGFPAAAERIPGPAAQGPEDGWQLPDEIWQRLAAGEYRIQVVDRRGRELLQVSFVKSG